MTRRFLSVSIIFNSLLCCFIWGGLLIFGGRGFDLSDTGLYLLSLTDYHNITIDTRWFAGLLRYLFALAADDVVLFRGLGIGLMLIMTTLTATIVIRSLIPARDGWQRTIAIIVITSAGVLYYRDWLITPSYNWLAFIGVLIFSIGLMLWLCQPKPRPAYAGAFISGISMGLVAWAKLTSLGLLLGVSLIFIPLIATLYDTQKRLAIRYWGVALAGLMLIVLAGLAQETSISNWLGKLGLGYEYQQLIRDNSQLVMTRFIIGPTQSLTRLAALAIVALLPTLWLMLVMGALVWIQTRRRAKVSPRQWQIMLGTVFALGLISITLGVKTTVDVGRWAVALFFLMGVLGLMNGWVVRKVALATPTPTTRTAPASNGRKVAVFICLFLVLSVVVSYGTRNYVVHLGTSAYLWVFASVLIVVRWHHTVLTHLILTGITLAIAFVMITTAQTPYRQAVPVWAMQTAVEIRNGRETVLVDANMATYLGDLQTTAYANGFVADTPVIDMTGHAPGAIYALDGDAYGFLWLLGGYAGSNEAARFVLENWQTENLQRAWILTSDGGRVLSNAILTDVGLDFPIGYEAVGDFWLPFHDETHTLWRPVSER